MYLTGALEVLCAILIVIPPASRVAAILVICVMLGALFSQVTHGEFAKIATPVFYLALASLVLYVRGGFRRPRKTSG